MTPNEDYPRMMFHRSGLLVVINSREEEDELGPAWRRTVWPAESELAVTGPGVAYETSGKEDIPIHPPVTIVPEPPSASAVPEPDPWAPDEASAFEPAPKKRKRR